MKVLLTGVYGPYDGLIPMSLFSSQVTRFQGLFNLLMNHKSFALSVIAENILPETMVLDFPTWEIFTKELEKGYDYVGISFIVPNINKAKKMTRFIRDNYPNTKIILGGHGVAAIGPIEKDIPYDYICRGEGIKFMRELFGDDTTAPLKHPCLPASVNKRILGVPLRKINSGALFASIGCVNGCDFCATTHFFEKKCIQLFSAEEIFQNCMEMKKKYGWTDFFLYIENALKDLQLAKKLIALMEENNEAFSFGIFSSAETIITLGESLLTEDNKPSQNKEDSIKIAMNFLERLGVDLLWMGIESKSETYVKNKGIDFDFLIGEAKKHGISILSSSILFLPHHTNEQAVQEDVDFHIGLPSDLRQFMIYTPLPGTKLYQECLDKKNLVEKEKYLHNCHGQDSLCFTSPYFSEEMAREILIAAFKKSFEVNGPSILHMANTAIMGVLSLKHQKRDPFMEKRYQQRVGRARYLYPLLDSIVLFAPNVHSKKLAKETRQLFYEHFGRDFGVRLQSNIVKIFALKEIFLLWFYKNILGKDLIRQPKTLFTPYRQNLKP